MVVVSMFYLNTKDKCEIFSLIILSKCELFSQHKRQNVSQLIIFKIL